MIENTGYAAYNLYHSLRLHFKGDYDYIKYGGKTTINQETFLKRADKYFFYRLSRKYNTEEFKDFLIANLLENVNTRPGPLEKPEADEIYKKWLKITNSLQYHFENDIIYILEKYGNSAFKVRNGEHPALLIEVLQGRICKETLIIMNEFMNFFPTWSEKISDTVIWPELKRMYAKYAPFIKFDRQKYRNILKEKIKENAEV